MRHLWPLHHSLSLSKIHLRSCCGKKKWWCASGGVYVPCIYTHARWELLCAAQVFVVLVWRLLSTNDLPCASTLAVGRLDKVARADQWLAGLFMMWPSRWPLFTVKWLSLLEMGEETASTEEVNIHKSHKAYWGGGRGRWYAYRYTVTARMTPALRCAAMRAILMFP